MLIEVIFIPLLIAVFAFTYVEILTDNQMILSWWRKWLFIQFAKRNKTEEYWLFKIIVGCPHCVSGQIALWSYPILCIFDNELIDCDYHVVKHILGVSFAIFYIAVFKKIGIYETKDGE